MLPRAIRRPLTRGFGRPLESRFVYLSHLDYSRQEKAIISLVRLSIWESLVLKKGAKERWILASGFATLISIFFGCSLNSPGLGLVVYFGVFVVFFEIFVPIQTISLDLLPSIFPKMSKREIAQALVDLRREDPREILDLFRPELADAQKLDRISPKNLL